MGLEHTLFEWIDKSSLVACETVRRVYASWFDAFPTEHRARLLGDLRSKQLPVAEGGFFELYVFGLLRGCGYDVHTIAAQEGRSLPDFEIRATSGDRVLIEATILLDDPAEEIAERRLKDMLRMAVRHVRRHDFLVWIDDFQAGHGHINAADFARWACTQADALLLPQNLAAASMPGIGPVTYSNDAGWRIDVVITPRPTRTDRRSLFGGSGGGEAVLLDTRGRIQGKIRDKLRQHGDVKAQLVIALGIGSFLHGGDDFSVLEALLGTSACKFPVSGAGQVGEPEEYREPDGLWHKRAGEDVTRPAGVVLIDPASAVSLETRCASLWVNPHVRLPEAIRHAWPFERHEWCLTTCEHIHTAAQRSPATLLSA